MVSTMLLLRLALNQGVVLQRDPSIKLSTVTWMESELISGDENRVGADIRKYLAQIVGKFAYEWKSANEDY